MNNNNPPTALDKKKFDEIQSSLLEVLSKDPKLYTELIEKTQIKFRETHPGKEISSRIEEYFSSYDKVESWINNCFDEIGNYIRVILYPLYINIYIDMILKGYWNEGMATSKFYIGKNFLTKHKDKFPSFEKEIKEFLLLKDPINKNSPLLLNYIENKVHIYVPKTYYQFFFHFLSTNSLVTIMDIINKRFHNSSKI